MVNLTFSALKPEIINIHSFCRISETNRVLWKFTELSQHSDNNGVGSMRARFDLESGPSNAATISTQFNCEGTTLSGIDFQLIGSGYRLSLVKRRFISGKDILICLFTSHLVIDVNIAFRKIYL